MALSVDVPKQHAGTRPTAGLVHSAVGGRPEHWLFKALSEAPLPQVMEELSGSLDDPDARHPELHSRSYVHFAASRSQHLGGCLEVVCRLRDLGVDLDIPDAVGQTPMFFAAREGNGDCVRLLARSKGNVDRQDRHGQTPIFYAAREGHVSVIRLLQRFGASSRVTDRKGQTPLFYAAREGHTSCAELLMKMRCSLDQTDSSGQSPLFYAVRAGQVPMIRWFRRASADFGLSDSSGKTLVAYANNGETHEELAKSQANMGIRPVAQAKLCRNPASARVAGRHARTNGLDNDYDDELGLPGLEAARGMPVVPLRGLLGEADVSALLKAAELEGTGFGSVSRDGNGTHQLQGCWTTHYLHTDAWFQKRFPALFRRLTAAGQAVDRENWGLLASAECAGRLGPPVPRTIELHTVHAGGTLADPTHFDSGSLWTLDVMLADPGVDFEGGDFQTPEDDGTLRRHFFGRGDAVVFVSHKQHCVSPVLQGCRQVLVIEFWHGEERRCAHRCTSRWGPCDYCLATSVRDRISNAASKPESFNEQEFPGFGIPANVPGRHRPLWASIEEPAL